jgi:RNA polymerase sigma-70 factor (ECF subfamily)
MAAAASTSTVETRRRLAVDSNQNQSKQLVQRASAGDREALDQLFQRSLPRLKRFLALKAGPGVLRGNEIEDLVQEAYLEAVRCFDDYTYQGPDSFFRWLATVAMHKLQNLHRLASAKKRSGREQPIDVGQSTLAPGVAEPRDAGPGPRTLTVGAEQAARLDVAMAKLSEVDRQVIAMSRVQGLSLQEIAEQMGRTRNAVALLLSRALRKLKDLLGEEPR